jgi:hypothetical protein
MRTRVVVIRGLILLAAFFGSGIGVYGFWQEYSRVKFESRASTTYQSCYDSIKRNQAESKVNEVLGRPGADVIRPGWHMIAQNRHVLWKLWGTEGIAGG